MATTLARPGRFVKHPLTPVHGACRWVRRLGDNPVDERSGILEVTIDGKTETYGVIDQGGSVYDVFRVGRRDKKVHTLERHTDGKWFCSCEDAFYCPERPGGCRHMAFLGAALKAVGR